MLVGPPNVGKSSLFNALLGSERALVDAEPGTTRDIISAPLRMGGLLFVLHDTAGLRDGGGRVEAMGMEKTAGAVASADIVLDLREASQEEASVAPRFPAPEGAAVLRVLTKGDLRQGREAPAVAGAGSLVTSCADGTGIDELRRRICGAVSPDVGRAAELGLLLNQRHQQRLMDFRASLSDLLGFVQDGAEEEVTATLLGAALAGLGEVSGRVFTEELLREIFGHFCVGK